MPIDYAKYPSDWKSSIRPSILERAGHCCEACGVENYAVGFRDRDGDFYTEKDINQYVDPHSLDVDPNFKVIKIVLSISHQDHDITNNVPSNLKALCQRCHFAHDRDYNRKKRAQNCIKKKIAKGQLIFTGL